MKKLLFAVFIIVVAKINAQYSIPAPLETEALTKLKTSDALLSELKANGLSIIDITIKLKKKEVLFLSSDEVCYRIYKDSKKLEGSNYVFDFDIITKPNKSGDVYTSTGHVWYTRVDITETTCNIGNKWTYEYSQADAFSLVTKNGFLTAAQAEKMILDTLGKGFDLDSYIHQHENKTQVGGRWTEICRIDNFKSCDYDKFEYANYSQVINKMEDNKHRISFEVEIYRGKYETGAEYASMFSVTKSYSLINCYFERKNGKVVFSSIKLVDDKNPSILIEENPYGRKPLDIYYLPISKTKIENIRNKYTEGKPSSNSILFYIQPIKELTNELNACDKKDYESYYSIFIKYCTEKLSGELAKEISELYATKYKSGPWELTIDDSVISGSIKSTFTSKKSPQRKVELSFATDRVVFKDNKYWLD